MNLSLLISRMIAELLGTCIGFSIGVSALGLALLLEFRVITLANTMIIIKTFDLITNIHSILMIKYDK